MGISTVASQQTFEFQKEFTGKCSALTMHDVIPKNYQEISLAVLKTIIIICYTCCNTPEVMQITHAPPKINYDYLKTTYTYLQFKYSLFRVET